MDLPESPDRAPIPTRVPASGLKWMLAILLVCGALAIFGQWERSRRSQIDSATVIPTATSPSPSPQESGY
jgi:hypothetical protein